MYGVVLIMVLVITGGVIAFIGDRLGTKIGKKKLSIFGLRPRHTSIVVTIITGILITTLTFIVMAAASENVRLALFGMEKLNNEMHLAQTNLAQASSDLTVANKARDQAKKDLKVTQDNLEELQQKQASLLSRNAALEAGNKALEANNEQLSANNAALESAKEALQSQNAGLTQNNSELNTANGKLTAENTSLEDRNKTLGEGLQMIREGDIIYQAGEIIASGVIGKGKDKQSISAEMASIVYLANRNVTQKTGMKTDDGGVWIYQKEYEQVIETLERADTDVVVRIVAAGNLIKGEPVRTHIELYPNRTIYEKNEFVFSQKFSLAGKDSNEGERTVISFLKNVNATAVQKGILPDPIKGSVGVIGGTQFYDVVNSLVSIHGDILLSAYAAQSTDAVGPLRLRLKVEQFK